MSIDMVKYYYKDPNTGVEVTFSKSPQFGWAVQYHVSKEDMFDMLVSGIKLPWPELSEEEQRVVNKNYADLRERVK